MKSIEVYGFVGWVTSYIFFFIYILWAFIPDEHLQALGIHYYPSKYWSLAIPSIIVMAMLTLQLSYYAINFMTFCSYDSLNVIEDDKSRHINLKKTELNEGLPEVYDMPVPVVNNLLYYQPHLIEKYNK